MIQKPSNELTLIVYDTPKPPKYIKINKLLMKILIFFIPLIVLLSTSFSMLLSIYMKKKLEDARSQEPEIIINLRNKNLQLTTELKTLRETKAKLIQKISSGSSSLSNRNQGDEIYDFVNIFALPLGFEDKRNIVSAKLENFTHGNLNNKVQLKFDILNNKVNKSKLAGYISVLQYHKDGVSFYPSYNLSPEASNLIYSKGESFVVSRFRPVIAEFQKPKGSIVWYKVFIFSQSGDLLAFKKTKTFILD